MPHKSHLSQII